MYETLFSPCRIGTVTIPNRIVMEPLQTHLAEEDGCCSDADVAFYTARARGGVGLIQTGTICVDLKTGRANRAVLALDREEQVASYRPLTEGVHRFGSLIFAELFHPGRQGLCALNGGEPMLAPSRTVCAFVRQPTREMTPDQCATLVEQFAAAARRAQRAGFDGVTLHCAHGYLLNQFLSPYTNLRQDQYGGCPENRARIVVDIIRRIRGVCGHFPVLVRLSADEYLDRLGLPKEQGITPELAGDYALMFQEAGADAIDVSAGIYETMDTSWEPAGFAEGWKADLARQVKRRVTVPVICTSVIRTAAFAQKLVEENFCDFVGSARTFLADPEWANKVRRGREDEIAPCISCLHCFDTLLHADETGGGICCSVNPDACRELTQGALRTNGRGRTVVIVGGGPAGMEAARVLALRRFCPVLLEREDTLGGTLAWASAAPEKYRLEQLVSYLAGELKRLRVEVRLGCQADLPAVMALKPDGVVVATGAAPQPLSVPAAEGARVYSVRQVLSGGVDLTDCRVAVIGAGPTGMETADFLALRAKQVILCDRGDGIARTLYAQNDRDLEQRLERKNVIRLQNAELLEIGAAECRLTGSRGEQRLACDAVVMAIGTRPVRGLADELQGVCPEVVTVGDAAFGRNLSAAILESHDAALTLLRDGFEAW